MSIFGMAGFASFLMDKDQDKLATVDQFLGVVENWLNFLAKIKLL